LLIGKSVTPFFSSVNVIDSDEKFLLNKNELMSFFQSSFDVVEAKTGD
jgi:hypothetical protein